MALQKQGESQQPSRKIPHFGIEGVEELFLVYGTSCGEVHHRSTIGQVGQSGKTDLSKIIGPVFPDSRNQMPNGNSNRFGYSTYGLILTLLFALVILIFVLAKISPDAEDFVVFFRWLTEQFDKDTVIIGEILNISAWVICLSVILIGPSVEFVMRVFDNWVSKIIGLPERNLPTSKSGDSTLLVLISAIYILASFSIVGILFT